MPDPWPVEASDAEHQPYAQGHHGEGDAAVEAHLHAALGQAEQGLKATTLDATHADAKKAMESLQAK